MEILTKRRPKNHHFKIVPKPNRPFWDVIPLRKSLRKTLIYIKKKSGMGFDLVTKLIKIMFFMFLFP